MSYVNKTKTRAKIYCNNGVLIKGFVHLHEGERLQDFANDTKREFVPVTKVEMFYTQWPALKKIESSLIASKEVVLLNKHVIVWIEENPEQDSK
jgi:hypothetical protein